MTGTFMITDPTGKVIAKLWSGDTRKAFNAFFDTVREVSFTEDSLGALNFFLRSRARKS